MGDIVQLFKYPYPHVACGSCEHTTFHIRTEEIDGIQSFMSVICEACGNEIFVHLKPLFGEEKA